jgi:hypothetical protein
MVLSLLLLLLLTTTTTREPGRKRNKACGVVGETAIGNDSCSNSAVSSEQTTAATPHYFEFQRRRYRNFGP